jgi:hypothetical protein
MRSPQRLAEDVHQVVIAPVGDQREARRGLPPHERLYPGPYLELFGRKPRPTGLSGNEVPPRRSNRHRGSAMKKIARAATGIRIAEIETALSDISGCGCRTASPCSLRNAVLSVLA